MIKNKKIFPIHQSDKMKSRESDAWKDRLTICSDIGDKKEINEDRIGFLADEGSMRIVIADGHWGYGAAELAAEYFISSDRSFPKNRAEAIQEIEELELSIFDEFGSADMDEHHDLTPETSILAVEIENGRASIMSYGDCRLLIVRSGEIIYEHEKNETWLGAFSHLQLRSRMSVEQATCFESIAVEKEDYILLFTDGLDECVYEVPTISMEAIAAETLSQSPREVSDALLEKAFSFGAEDNISIAAYRA